ncbi:unnamed protein product [Arabis nemorensis]|uniref:Uncharacterized protein n=1 Tax=Arabis nemorensis TaxID=586526 RepID=A0A565B6J3_9BRAS|nr:unnamed protein product [Arabis nemorensis]
MEDYMRLPVRFAIVVGDREHCISSADKYQIVPDGLASEKPDRLDTFSTFWMKRAYALYVG